ncbi:MAG: potassium channel family protein [Acidimicrobiia bacterium]
MIPANITTLGTAIWWACVTVFTVGYGDYYPITFGGQLFAVLLMALGLVSAAVITAQIASTFMDQAAARRAAFPDGPSTDERSTDAPSTSRVEEAMARIEATAQRMEDRLGQIERSVAGLSAPESPGSSAPGSPGT